MSGNNKEKKSISFQSILNYVIFSLLFSLNHATVDAILAYSSSELGSKIGSYSGFILYLTYTFTSLLFSAATLTVLSPKNGVLVGLIGLLIYVSTFLLSLFFREKAYIIFCLGSAIGGIGAGFLWTSQGVYFSINSNEYAVLSHQETDKIKNYFSSIFAMLYLFLEALVTLLSTIIYIYHSPTDTTWKIKAFSVYTILAFISVICFKFFVQDISSTNNTITATSNIINSTLNTITSHNDSNNSNNNSMNKYDKDDEECIILQEPYTLIPQDSHTTTTTTTNTNTTTNTTSTNINSNSNDTINTQRNTTAMICHELFSVVSMLFTNRMLQLLMPYQIIFGLSSCMFNYYISSQIVSIYIGDGYLGSLTALSVFTAAIISLPLSYFTNILTYGKHIIMIFGGSCYLILSIILYTCTDSLIGQYSFIIFIYILHGITRGIWESINKAVISETFQNHPKQLKCAFAALYFTSGLSGAIGFLTYQFMTKYTISSINITFSILAILCYMMTICMKPTVLSGDEVLNIDGNVSPRTAINSEKIAYKKMPLASTVDT